MSVSRMVRMSVEYECAFCFLAFVEEIAASLEDSIGGTVTQTWHSETMCAIDVGGTRIGAAYESADIAPEGAPCLTLSLGNNGIDAGPCLLRENRDDFLASVQRLLCKRGDVKKLMTVDFNTFFSPETYKDMRKLAGARVAGNSKPVKFTEVETPSETKLHVLPRRVTAQGRDPRDRCVKVGRVHLTGPQAPLGGTAKLYSDGKRLIQVPDTNSMGDDAIRKWALRSPEDPVQSKRAPFAQSVGQILVASFALVTLGQAAAASLLSFGG